MARLKRCKTCIGQHAKCNGSKPTCGRCKIKQVTCSWINERRRSMVFCAENEIVQGSARRARGPPKRMPQDDVVQLDAKEFSRFTGNECRRIIQGEPPETWTRDPLMISVSCPASVMTHAMNKYFHCFLHQNHEARSTIEGFIARFGLTEPDRPLSPLLACAFSAVVLIFFGLTEKSLLAMTKSGEVYGQALYLTTCALQQPANTTSDELLLSIMLLGVYEGHTGSSLHSAHLPDSFRHIQGATKLLRFSDHSHTCSHRSRSLHNVIFRRSVRMALQAVDHVDPAARLCNLHQRTDEIFLMQIYTHMIEIADLNADLQAVLRLQPSHYRDTRLSELLDATLRLDGKMMELESAMVRNRKYHSSTVQNGLERTALKQIMHGYYLCVKFETMHAAHEMTLLHGSWLRLKDIILRIMRHGITPKETIFQDPLDQSYQNTTEDAIEVLVVKIFSSIAFFLNDIDNPARTVEEVCLKANATHCGHAVFSLHSICSAYNVTPKHRTISRDLLVLISRPPANNIFPALFSPDGRLGHTALSQKLGGMVAYA